MIVYQNFWVDNFYSVFIIVTLIFKW